MLASCAAEDPSYRYGVRLSELELELYTLDVGVYPDTSILADPANPFSAGLEGDTKWRILDDGPVAAFYAWASMLALEPTGEHQYYAALQAEQIYDGALCRAEDVPRVWDIGVRGYQQVLDAFPGSVTYDATGRYAFPLGPLAIHGIERLGGIVQHGWVVVTEPDGTEVAVQTSAQDP
jgi:hypothetical protein